MAQNDPNWTQVVGAIGQFVTWLLVVVGWCIVNTQHNQRETRKEIRDRVEELRKSVHLLEIISEEYHMAQAHSEEKAKEIKISLMRIKYAIDHIGFNNCNIIDTGFIGLRRAITLNNFDTKRHEAQSLSGELIANINAYVDTLMNLVESEFRSRFPVK